MDDYTHSGICINVIGDSKSIKVGMRTAVRIGKYNKWEDIPNHLHDCVALLMAVDPKPVFNDSGTTKIAMLSDIGCMYVSDDGYMDIYLSREAHIEAMKKAPYEAWF